MSDRLVDDSYAEQAPIYDDVYGGLALSEAEISALSSLIPMNGSVLELGTGTGRVIVPLLRNVRAQRGDEDVSFVGVDRSSSMIEVARAKAPDDVLWVQSDVTAADLFSNLQSRSFDLIIVVCGLVSLLNLKQRRALLLNARRLLAPSGRLLVETHEPSVIRELADHRPVAYSPAGLRSGLVTFSEIVDDVWRADFVWIADAKATYFVESSHLVHPDDLDELALEVGLSPCGEHSEYIDVLIDKAQNKASYVRLYTRPMTRRA